MPLTLAQDFAALANGVTEFIRVTEWPFVGGHRWFLALILKSSMVNFKINANRFE